jgi:hypothetical protein
MTAPTITEPPELPSFPTGPGLPDQPGVFIPKFLLFLAWFTTFRAYLVELIAYLESIGGTGSGSTDSGLRWNVSDTAATSHTLTSADIGAHKRFTSDSDAEIVIPDDGHGFSFGDRVRVTQAGDGDVTINPASTVTVNSLDGARTSAGHGAVFEIEYVGVNEWDALGDLIVSGILLSGDMTDGDDAVLLSGDMTDGDDSEQAGGV